MASILPFWEHALAKRHSRYGLMDEELGKALMIANLLHHYECEKRGIRPANLIDITDLVLERDALKVFVHQEICSRCGTVLELSPD